jgi:hypothetical protein
MKNTEQFLRNILKRTINETLEEKADELMSKIKEMEEAYGDMPGLGDETPDFNIEDYEDFYSEINTEDSMYLPNYISKRYNDEEDLDLEFPDLFAESLNEGKMCECGGHIEEGQCMECGKLYEGIYDVAPKFSDDNEFDYVAEEEEDGMSKVESLKIRTKKFCKDEYDKPACDAHKEMLKQEMEKEELTEKLHGKQKMLDKNKNNKIDAEDFELLRKKKKEMEEGNKFTGMLAKARKGDKFSIGGKTYTDTSDYDVNESIEYHIEDFDGDIIELTENELVDLIENIVNEDKSPGLKTIGKPKGLTTYEKAHRGSGKENDDYLKSVTKKMKDYLKDGSKGQYSMNPVVFPQGNGQLAKMAKKAYVPSSAVQDYIDNFTAASLENLDYDGIEPNEDWVDDLVKGASRTGNNPEWANAVETGVNTKRNKIRQDNLLGKVKKKAYNKAPQPIVSDKTGEDEGDKILRQLESVDEKSKTKINEEFERMKSLFSYNKKTQ